MNGERIIKGLKDALSGRIVRVTRVYVSDAGRPMTPAEERAFDDVSAGMDRVFGAMDQTFRAVDRLCDEVGKTKP